MMDAKKIVSYFLMDKCVKIISLKAFNKLNNISCIWAKPCIIVELDKCSEIWIHYILCGNQVYGYISDKKLNDSHLVCKSIVGLLEVNNDIIFIEHNEQWLHWILNDLHFSEYTKISNEIIKIHNRIEAYEIIEKMT